VSNEAGDLAAEPPILTDIATAQELFGRVGRLSRIDLRLTEAEARALAASVPPGTLLVPAASSQDAFAELAAAFRVNLTALGLLALAVGAFLIYGTMSFAVLQRRTTLGVLRALGVTRIELLRSVLVEALGVAVLATSIGLVLGHLLAMALVDLVLRTIGDLSFGANVTAASPSPWTYVRGATLGIAATLLAAAKPALDAVRLAPAVVLRRAALERGAHRSASAAARLALPVLVGGALLLFFGPSRLEVGFAALAAVLAAGALLTPLATALLMRAIDKALGRRASLATHLAVRGVDASLSRTGVATAALAVAVATVCGIGLMIASFRASLSEWLDTTLTADLYVGFERGGWLAEPAALERIAGIEGVDGLSLTRNVVTPSAIGEIAIRAMKSGSRGWGLEVLGTDPGNAMAGLAEGHGVLASERLMFARSLEVGDRLALPTLSGQQELPVLGAFRDFNTGSYSIVMALERYQRDWGDLTLTGIGIDLRDEAEPAKVEEILRAEIGPGVEMRVRSSAGILRLSLDVFDRTFKITEVLRVLAGIVAFLGILSALLALELERAHETAVLRTLGFSPRELARTSLVQTSLLGLAAGLIAIPIGITLAALLVHVINRRSFGWSMDFVVTPGPLLIGLALAMLAAIIAGIYPAWRASRIPLSAALREE